MSFLRSHRDRHRASAVTTKFLTSLERGQKMVDLASAVGVGVDRLVDLAFDLRRDGRLRWSSQSQLFPARYLLPQYEPIGARGV